MPLNYWYEQYGAIGYRRRLFGRWHPKFYPNGVKGSLNRGNFRTGWGHKAGRGDVFRTSLTNGKHIDWFHRY